MILVTTWHDVSPQLYPFGFETLRIRWHEFSCRHTITVLYNLAPFSISKYLIFVFEAIDCRRLDTSASDCSNCCKMSKNRCRRNLWRRDDLKSNVGLLFCLLLMLYMILLLYILLVVRFVCLVDFKRNSFDWGKQESASCPGCLVWDLAPFFCLNPTNTGVHMA